ncbi:PAP2 domain protein [Aspergillus heteromorphus CBS 117.55]|uniref:PAP2 domain protein n=1 Tax=Aspergillus heteromorphus CBS 117.55 TaxID=1448321 RepID=A0A317W728_9EURO|nr:PAP2 domain protein [Aspergillus heteromorphus CBS 117.55]PWY81869.1 PAP2 domain protein [Aspergillus heteromorphus CBS 117.55]
MASPSHKPEHSTTSTSTSTATAPRALALAHIPKRLILSYVIDWILIIAIGLTGYGFSHITPSDRPFSLSDASISFPHKDNETVSTAVLAIVSLLAPAAIILLVTVTVIPSSSGSTRARRWRYKLWEWNVGWLGLGISFAGAYMATEGLKDLYGKPRPDLLARCRPDVAHVGAYAVGGLGTRLAGAATMVTWGIFSFAGLGYLSLWLCAKFAIGFPYLDPYRGYGPDGRRSAIPSQGAAPPVHMLIVALVPVAVASFISASRWFDYRHHGFDIIFGSVLGMFFAWIGFRMFQLPVMRGGAGWSWGARSRKHAFFRGIGLPSHLVADTWGTSGDSPEAMEKRARDIDLESARQGPDE